MPKSPQFRAPEHVIVQRVEAPPRKGTPPHIFVVEQWENNLIHHPPSVCKFPTAKERHAYTQVYCERQMVYNKIKSLGMDQFEIDYKDFIKPGKYTALTKAIRGTRNNTAGNKDIASMLSAK